MDLESGYGHGLALYISRGLVRTVERAQRAGESPHD
jgi:hypothetical protein